ncbi:MAG: gamma-glutamylcyclotransferase family protein [Methylocella sp.]
MSHDYLFVYGTLRRDINSEMHHLLARYGKFLGDATFQGKLYMLDYYPGLVQSDNPQDVVNGEVYKLSCPNAALSRLDDYEECGPTFSEPTKYVRRKLDVKLKMGEVISAWIYIFARPTIGLRLIQSGDFLRRN